jgi:hypothetical protein
MEQKEVKISIPEGYEIDKEKELELKVAMFCAAISGNQQICDDDCYINITGLAKDINSAFNILNKD